MNEPWYWLLTAILAGLGTVLFLTGHRLWDGDRTAVSNPLAKTIGLAGLILVAWGVLLAAVGGAWWLGVVVAGRCVP